jgi:hypothetical protein
MRGLELKQISKLQGKTHPLRALGVTLALAVGSLIFLKGLGAQRANGPPIDIPVRWTDVREASGIIFKQDSTQTEQKYYLETLGTGVGWIDYDQDGLMDLYFVQAGATDA